MGMGERAEGNLPFGRNPLKRLLKRGKAAQ